VATLVAGRSTIDAVGRPRALLLRASLVLLGVAALSKVVTLAADSLVAWRFGLSASADAYLLAIGIVGVALAAPGETLRLSIVPICGRQLALGRTKSAAGLVLLVLLGVLGTGGAVALCMVAAAPWLARLLAPGFDGGAAATLTQLLRIMAPAVLLGLLLAVLLGVLHTQLRFGLPALAGIGPSAGVLLAALVLGGALGVNALAAGYVLGTAAVVGGLAWAGRGLLREGAAVREARRELGPLLRLALPTGLAISIVSTGAIAERAIASLTGAGDVAALGFSIKLLTQAAILSQSVWTPLTPLLTAARTPASKPRNLALVPFSLRLVLLVLVPATALLIALREPLVGLVFERGAFTAGDTARTATLLALHSGSLVGEGVFMVSVAALLSLHDSATRLIASVLFLASKLALMAALAPLVGVAGIALAASASSLLAGAYSVRVLGRHLDDGALRALAAFAAKAVVAGLLALGAALVCSEVLAAHAQTEGEPAYLARLAIGTGAGLAAYAAALLCLGVEEAQMLARRVLGGSHAGAR
jgi:putative peptidoglycan lipid II flippase